MLGAQAIHQSFEGQWRRLVLLLHHGLNFTTPACTTGFCDSTMFWVAGSLTRHGQAALLYDPATYTQAARRLLPYTAGYWPFIYPPSVLAPAAFLSNLALPWAYYCFTLTSVAVSIMLFRYAGVAWWCLLAGLLSPAALWCVYLGQLGLLCGALLIAGLVWMERRPARSAALLALLCIKPPYALLLPLVVLAGRRWRAMAAALVVLGCILAIATIIGGPGVWRAYAGPGRVAMRGLLERPFGPGFQAGGTSIFWMLRSFGAALPFAYGGQALCGLLAGIYCWRLWARPAGQTMQRAAVTLCLTLFTSPYGFTHDLSGLSMVLPTFARRGTPWRNAAIAWLWLAPAFVPRFAGRFGFLPTPFLSLAALLIMMAATPTERTEHALSPAR